MALTDETGTVMPVMPMGNNGGIGDFGGGGWWILLLFILLGGWGNGFGGFGGNDNLYPWMNQSNQIASGFANQANGLAIGNIQNAITSGFGDMQTALCSGFGQAEIANNSRQIANMQQGFGMQTAITSGLNNLSSQLATCCCENRLATQGLQSVIQSENCADRAAISDGIRDILVAQNAGTQRILDMMCQDKLDSKNEKILELQNRLNMAEFAASQVAQNNYLQNALTAQTQYFVDLYPPTAARFSAAS